MGSPGNYGKHLSFKVFFKSKKVPMSPPNDMRIFFSAFALMAGAFPERLRKKKGRKIALISFPPFYSIGVLAKTREKFLHSWKSLRNGRDGSIIIIRCICKIKYKHLFCSMGSGGHNLQVGIGNGVPGNKFNKILCNICNL